MKSHIQLTAGGVPPRVIVCGSPERAELIARHLQGSTLVAKNREYHSYVGAFEQVPILVTSHGVGSAGAAICFQELIDVGAKAIIRIGTAGGLQDDAKIGDIVIPTAAIRDDGVSERMVPKAYPAVPSFELTGRLLEVMRRHSTPQRSGLILTSDLFYPGLLDGGLLQAKQAGAIAVEMECATLFVIGLLRRVQTAAVVVLDGNPLKWAEGQYDPDPKRLQSSVEAAIRASLETLKDAAVG